MHACYSDLPVVYTSSGLASGGGPFSAGVNLDQPPLTAFLSWLVARVAPHQVTVAAQRSYFDAAAVLLLLAASPSSSPCTPSPAASRLDAVLLAASPSSCSPRCSPSTSQPSPWPRPAGLLGTAASRRGGRPAGAGARSPAVPRPAARGARAPRAADGSPARGGDDGRDGGPRVARGEPARRADRLDRVGGPLRSFLDQRAGYGSLWLLPQLVQQAVGAKDASGLPGGAVVVLTLGAWVVWVLLVAVFVLWAPRRPRLAQVAFLLVAGFCVLGASFPPQASLWLLPLAVLAVPRWRDHLLWWGAEVAYFGAVWLYIAGQTNTNRALPPELYAAALLARTAAVAWLVVCVVREVRRPADDPVRATRGLDDPAGGDFDRAPDALVVRVA